MTPTSLQAAARPAAQSAAPAQRLDLYAAIHKALRNLLSDTLLRVGQLDVRDDAETAAVGEQVDAMLFLLAAHLNKENTYIHPAIEARLPGGANRTQADHQEHEEALDSLAADLQALRSTAGDARQTAADRLYRHLGLFTAENLQHMHVEETANNQALWASYTDDELHDIHAAILAGLSERERQVSMRWMLPALNPAERAAMLGGMRAQMPPQIFQGMLPMVQGLIGEPAWAKLSRDLGL